MFLTNRVDLSVPSFHSISICFMCFEALSFSTCIFRVVTAATKLLQSCVTLCNPMEYSPAGSYVHGILQARIMEWVAIFFSRGSSQPKDQAWISSIAGGFFTV